MGVGCVDSATGQYFEGTAVEQEVVGPVAVQVAALDDHHLRAESMDPPGGLSRGLGVPDINAGQHPGLGGVGRNDHCEWQEQLDQRPDSLRT